MSTTTLPYYRAEDLLPSPLPTQKEIDNASTTLPTIRSPVYDGRIVVIRDQYVVKYGAYVPENEGHALLFIERNLSIPAPRLYALYRKDEKVYLIMDYILGTNLESIWTTLSKDDKRTIVSQLRAIFDEIRSLPPCDFFGSVERGPVPHRYFYSETNDPAATGPFETEGDFQLAIARRSRLLWEGSNRSGISEFFRRNLPSALKGHDSVFTHSDLHPQNIIVQKKTELESGKDYYVVAAVIDWETAGWYPAYWEYAAAFALLQWSDDWPESLEKIVDPWPLEGTMMRFIHQVLEF